MVQGLKELVERVDSSLHAHLVREKVDFMQFAFRWMNCLLMREISLDLVIRLWDTYLSEEVGSFEKLFTPRPPPCIYPTHATLTGLDFTEWFS